MRRRTVILILSVVVAIFCVHNVYQSWLMVQDSREFSDGRSVIWNHHGRIQVLSGGRKELSLEEAAQIRGHVPDLGAQNIETRISAEDERFRLLRLTNGSDYQRRINKVNLMDYDSDNIGYVRRRADSGINTIDVTWATGGPGAKPDCALHFPKPVYKVVNGTKRYVPLWQRKLDKCGQLGRLVNGTRHFYLAELLQVRIYESDKAKWTIKELKQWLHFMFLIGVEHVFVCDHYKFEREKLDIHLKRYIDLGLVTYLPWSDIRNPMNAQVRCYQYIIDTYKRYTRWQMAIDMDEYPFAPTDHREGFVSRYLRNMTYKYGTRVTEVSMSNFLMLGQGDRKQQMVISRINRMTPKPANMLVKPIYRPERVKANIHHNHLVSGSHLNADTGTLRMLHYWGARGQDWGPDTPHTLNITREMNDMRETWTRRVRDSLIVFGEMDAFSNTTGP